MVFKSISLAVTALVLSNGLNAAVVNYDYVGRVTVMSGFGDFNGLNLGDYLTGSFSYDTDALPTTTEGFWSATYKLNSPQSLVTTVNNETYTYDSYTATVEDGPALPPVERDSFALETSPIVLLFDPRSSPLSSVSLDFQNTGNLFPLESISLPNNLNLTDFPLSSGLLSYLIGSFPVNPTDDFYWRTGPQTRHYVGASGENVIVQQDDPDYLEWLALGNETVGINKVHFQLTSLSVSAVPIPAAVWLFGSGLLGLIAVARRKA